MAGSPSSVEQFVNLAKTFANREEDYQSANRLLDNIIADEYSDSGSLEEIRGSKEVVSEFALLGAQMLSNGTLLLCSKFGQTLSLLIQNYKVKLTDTCVEGVVRFFIRQLEQCKSSLAAELLSGLVTTVNANTGKLPEETVDLILGPGSPIWSNLSTRGLDPIIQRTCFSCINAMLPRPEDRETFNKFYIKVCYQQTVNHLRILLGFVVSDDLGICKIALNALRTLQKILEATNEKDDIVEAEILLAILKVFTIYGLPGFQSRLSHLTKNLPSAREGPSYFPVNISLEGRKEKSPLSKKMVTSTKQRKRKTKNRNKRVETDSKESGETVDSQTGGGDGNDFGSDLKMFHFSRSSPAYSSSESELSDADTEMSVGLVSCKVRHAALRCIQNALQSIDRKLKFACWLLLVPESYSDIEPSLLSFLENDPSIKVRITALNALLELLNGSKLFLDHAMAKITEHQELPRSFVPFSTKLTQSVHQLHSSLLSCMLRETQPTMQERIVKCFTLVVLNCPYDKLGPNWPKKFVPVMTDFLNSRDQNLTIAAMTCLAAIMSVKDRTGSLEEQFKATNQVLKSNLLQNVGAKPQELTDFDSSWFTLFCFRLTEKSNQDDQVGERYICESLQVLTVILRTYPELVNRYSRTEILQVVLMRLLSFSSTTLAFYAVKLLEEVGKFFGVCASSSPPSLQNEGMDFWTSVIPGPILSVMQSPETAVKVKAAACDWVATIGPEFFSQLEYRYQIMCKTLLLGTSQDGDDQIKAAAVRALGVIIMYPCMKEDLAFIVDTGTIMMGHLKSSNVTLQMKAAWSIGNLCDSCVKNGLMASNDPSERLPEDFVLELLTTSTRVSEDNDKVKSNGVRAVGNLIRCMPKDMLELEKFKAVIEKTVEAVSKNVTSGPMKGRWNACYACSNIFHNSNLRLGQYSWKKPILLALVTSLKDCKNFKVRIGAVSALRLLTERQCFGDEALFKELWVAVLEALTSSESMADFLEFRYKDTLQTQICDLICHLLSLASNEDLENIQSSFPEHSELLAVHLDRYFQRSDFVDEQSASCKPFSCSLVNNQKLLTWQTVKSSLLRVKLSSDLAVLIDKVDNLFL